MLMINISFFTVRDVFVSCTEKKKKRKKKDFHVFRNDLNNKYVFIIKYHKLNLKNKVNKRRESYNKKQAS